MEFVVYLMFLICLWNGFENGVHCMTEVTQYADYVSWKDGLEFHKGCCVTLETCFNLCTNHTLCDAVFHHEETSQCHLYKAVLQSLSDAFVSTGWRYYTNICEDGWYKYGVKCYQTSTVTRQWTDAQTICNDQGGHLAVIDSAIVKDGVGQYTQTNKRYWIGGRSEDGSNNFKWYPSMVNLTDTYTNWAGGEPNNQGVICVEIRGDLTGYLWNDDYCYKVKYFICEKPL